MYQIDNEILASTKSPGRHLLVELHKDILRCAIEREEDFKREISSFTLQYLESRDFICDRDVSAKRIRISTFAAEAIWASTHSTFTLYIEKYQNYDGNQAREINLICDPVLGPAIEPISWALDNLVHGKKTPYPDGIPAPLAECEIQGNSNEHVSHQISRRTLAALMHHEFAHIRLGHEGCVDIQAEKDADHESWEWIISVNDADINSTGNPGEKMLRLLSIANSLVFLLARDIHLNRLPACTHPRSIDRLCDFLSRYNLDENHLVYAYLCAAIPLHAQNASVVIEKQVKPFDTLKECCEHYLEQISRLES